MMKLILSMLLFLAAGCGKRSPEMAPVPRPTQHVASTNTWISDIRPDQHAGDDCLRIGIIGTNGKSYYLLPEGLTNHVELKPGHNYRQKEDGSFEQVN
jgi:hypothetical protein